MARGPVISPIPRPTYREHTGQCSVWSRSRVGDRLHPLVQKGCSLSRPLLVLAAIYLAVIGFSLLLVPAQFGVGAVPSDASPELLALLRLLGGPMIGIAVLNWMSRGAESVSIRNAVVLANLVGFGVVAANDVWGVATGEARDLAKIFLVVHLLFTIAFATIWFRAGGRRSDGRATAEDR